MDRNVVLYARDAVELEVLRRVLAQTTHQSASETSQVRVMTISCRTSPLPLSTCTV